MDASRSSTPDPPQDLWSSILDSVSSSRSIPSKQVIVLGEPSTGKSTITSALLARPVEDSNAEIRDFAIGYEYADVRDDEGMNSLHISTHKVDKKNHYTYAGRYTYASVCIHGTIIAQIVPIITTAFSPTTLDVAEHCDYNST